MARKHGPWTVEETSRKYRNDFIEVSEDRVTRPDGEPGTYATVSMTPGVSVLPIDGEQVYLTRQFRYAVGKESIEVASGALDGEEDPREGAARELREELGIEAGEWIDAGLMDVDTSIVRAPVRQFVALDLTFTETEREGTEVMETLKVPLTEAERMVLDGEITHGPSCVLILKAARLLARRERSCP